MGFLQDGITDLSWENGDGATSGDDPQKIVPSASDTTTMSFDQIFQWNRHFLYYQLEKRVDGLTFDGAGSVDVTAYTE